MAYKSNIPKFNDQLQKQVNKTMFEVGATVKASAVKNAPNDQGGLRRSIKYRTTGTGDETKVTVGSNLEYATYQEFGTGEFAENGKGRKGGWAYKDPKTGKRIFTLGNKPTKFLRRAFRDNKQRVETKIANDLRGLS
ncbi:HK97-gp10 family putative phage morphogenesis protein [Weissella tructae]